MYLSQNNRLYACFIDYSTAFDTVWRAGLWLKLIRSGVTGKVLRVVVNMYQHIKSCVSVGGENSQYFTSNVGVRQGENLSPLLFATYINDLEEYLVNLGCAHIDPKNNPHLLRLVKICILLYADDTVLFADSEEGLQHALNAMAKYCSDWKLKVNIVKTKVMIFEKRKRKQKFLFMYDDTELEIVDTFKYLGVVFAKTGKFSACKQLLVDQARKAMYSVLRRACSLQLPLEVQLHLFQATVVPILTYGCEAWGHEVYDTGERLLLKFCKSLLHVKSSTPSCMVYGELGCYPLSVEIRARVLSFWSKLLEPNDKVCNKLYSVLYHLHVLGMYTSPWLKYVMKALDDLGLTYVWNEQYVHNDRQFNMLVKERVKDQYRQEWHETVFNMSKCYNYRMYKDVFVLEHYLTTLPYKYRVALCKFRTTNHNLAVEVGRYTGIPRVDRHCNLCRRPTLGDEFHFIFHCTALSDLRSRYVSPYYVRNCNALSYKQLFTTTKKRELLRLSKFVWEGLRRVDG